MMPESFCLYLEVSIVALLLCYLRALWGENITKHYLKLWVSTVLMILDSL